MDQPTLTPSASSAAPLFLPTMPTSWLSSSDTQSNPNDRVFGKNGSHRLSISNDSGLALAASTHMLDTSEVRQPVPVKPLNSTAGSQQPIFPKSTTEEFKHDKLPLLSNHFALHNEERHALQNLTRIPMNAPQLRMRPVSEANDTINTSMPSPIARRGEAERAFLQRQMKAESRIRREQARHNQERKLREENNAKVIPFARSCKEEEQDDDLASNERLALGISESAQHLADGKQTHLPHFLHNNRKHGRQQLLREFASSPPLILKKSFKRSVSAVLADSGIAEDENLLFFPDGLPLLNEQEEVNAALNDVIDGDSAMEACSPGGGGDDGSIDASERGIPEESPSTLNNNGPSPSLIAADVIWQIGASSCDDNLADELPLPHQLSKKVTLRPKMNAPFLTSSGPNPLHEFKPIGVPTSDTSCLNQAKKCIGFSDIAEEDKRPHDFSRRDRFSREILSASESFQHLSFENDDDKAWGPLNRSDSMGRASSCGSNSDGNKVPPFTFSSPEPGRNRQLCGSKDCSSHPIDDNFPLKEPISESNYFTPDNSEYRRFSRKIPSERLPKLPELGMPDVQDSNDGMLFRCEPAVAVQEQEDEFEIILNDHTSEINFYTPEVSKP